MKRIILNILMVSMLFTLTRCFEEIPEEVTVIPQDEIEEKLKALRDLQKELRDENVNIVDYQDQIDNLINQINNLVPPGNVPLTYSIGVVSAAREDDQIGIAGATVSLDIRGARQTATTDSDGQVVFQDLRSGVVSVYISVNGYTDVNFIADLLVGSDEDYSATTEDYNVTTAIALYPTTAANGAVTVSGELYYDPNRGDDLLPTDPLYGHINFFTSEDNLEVNPFRPAPRLNFIDTVQQPTTYPILDARVQSWEDLVRSTNIFAFIQPNNAEFSYVPAGTPGNILLAMYEEMFLTTSSSASDGTFQLVIPVGFNGNSCRIHLEEFIGNESYIRSITQNTADGSTSISTKTRKVIYTALYGRFGYLPSMQYPGSSNAFDLSEVNNFTGTLWTAGSNINFEAEFYFGARTRDE